MMCLGCTRGLLSISRPAMLAQVASKPSTQRTFSSLTLLRPHMPSNTPFRPSSFLPTATSSTPAPSSQVLDLLPKISAHPALGATQVRCGPRDTFSPSHFVRKRRHGFLSRLRTRKGRATLKRRMKKGRATLSH